MDLNMHVTISRINDLSKQMRDIESFLNDFAILETVSILGFHENDVQPTNSIVDDGEYLKGAMRNALENQLEMNKREIKTLMGELKGLL